MTLGCDRVLAAITTTEVGDSLAFAAEVGLDSLLTHGILGGDARSYHVIHRASRSSAWMSALHIVPQVKVLMTLASVTLGSLLCFLEKH